MGSGRSVCGTSSDLLFPSGITHETQHKTVQGNVASLADRSPAAVGASPPLVFGPPAAAKAAESADADRRMQVLNRISLVPYPQGISQHGKAATYQ